MRTNMKLFIPCLAIVLMAFTVGCREGTSDIVLHFVFEDARGITVGSRVMGDGVRVGQVTDPPKSTEPRVVVVTTRIDGLSPEKMAYVTKDLSAVIRKDSLVAGQTYLDLVFPRQPGETVPHGTVLPGRGGPLDMQSFQGVAIPGDPQQFIDFTRMAFVSAHPAIDGTTVFYLNWLSIAIACLTIFALILDFLIRLPQGSKRERSSPLIFQKIWQLFCLVLAMRFIMFTVRSLGDMGVINNELLRSLHIEAAGFMQLLLHEWPFWVLVILLVIVRFKFDLLMRCK